MSLINKLKETGKIFFPPQAGQPPAHVVKVPSLVEEVVDAGLPPTPIEKLQQRLHTPGTSVDGHILFHLQCIVEQLQIIIDKK